jgi:16S rRNA (uracil1498-N3)-methyltransferase
VALPRFFIEAARWGAAAPELTGPEAHHAGDVLRLRVGDQALLFDGRGHELLVETEEVGRRQIRFRKIEEREAKPRPNLITLAQAIPKGKNMDLIVQKAVELGAAEIVPILSERTVVSLGKKEAGSKRAKWEQVVIEAGKQSGQSWLPEVREPIALKDFLQREAVGGRKSEDGRRRSTPHPNPLFGRGGEGTELKLVASLQEDSLHLKEVLRRYEAEHEGRPTRVTVLIGPEGDLTKGEYTAARKAGFQPITLGPIILRVETAAIYCLSVLSYELLGHAD